MSKVLLEASSLLCGTSAASHGGSVVLTGKGEPYFTVQGSPVLTLAALAGDTVSNCQFKTGSGPQPCVSVSAPTGGGAQALTASGKPVALDSLVALTSPNLSTVVVDDATDGVLTAG